MSNKWIMVYKKEDGVELDVHVKGAGYHCAVNELPAMFVCLHVNK